MNILQLDNVHKSFGARKAVNGVSFSISEGEIFGLLGPNGAGKSSTLSLISGLLKLDQGNIFVGPWDLRKNLQDAKGLIGIVPQEPALYPQLSAEANLAFWGTMNGIPKKDLAQAVANALHIVGLTDRATDTVGKYSGGMKRRLNIAAGLIHQPKLLIMDEPTVGVDPQSRSHILEMIKKLKTEGKTIIYTSHYVEEVELLCDRVAIMDHGTLLTIGTIPELLKKTSNHQTLTITFDTQNPNINVVAPLLQLMNDIHRVIVSERTIELYTNNAEQVLPEVFEYVRNYGLSIKEIKIKKPNLESLFLQLTGRALRD